MDACSARQGRGSEKHLPTRVMLLRSYRPATNTTSVCLFRRDDWPSRCGQRHSRGYLGEFARPCRDYSHWPTAAVAVYQAQIDLQIDPSSKAALVSEWAKLLWKA